MSNKAAVFPLVVDHLRTLSGPGGGSRGRWEIAGHYVMPLVASGVAVRIGARLTDAGQLIGGAAVLAGFAFGLSIFVFQLRLDAGRDPRVPRGGLLLELIDELFKNVSYAILIGLILVAVAVAGTSYADADAEHLNGWWTFAITAIGIHFIVTIAMCLKRIRSAYRQLTI